MKPLCVVVVSLFFSFAAAAQESQFNKGVAYFFDAKIKEALVEWDAEVAASPAKLPYHWQRGIALYYAGRFQDGRDQFEVHQKVNPEDVENAVWHFLCVAKLDNAAAARKVFIPITHDERVPMKEIHALFAGTGTSAAVMEAAAKTEGISPAAQQMQLNYANLYLGLYAEANGDKEKALQLIERAAKGFPKGDRHYMGEVARVHVKLRKGS